MPIVLPSSTCAGWSAGCAAAIRTAPYLMPGRGGTSRNALVLPFFFFFWLYLVPFSLHPTWSDGHWLTVLTLIFPRLHICSADPFIYLFVCDLFPFSLLTVMYRLATTRPLSATVAIFSLAVRVSGWNPQSNRQNAIPLQCRNTGRRLLPCRLRRLWFALPIDTNKKKKKNHYARNVVPVQISVYIRRRRLLRVHIYIYEIIIIIRERRGGNLTVDWSSCTVDSRN